MNRFFFSCMWFTCVVGATFRSFIARHAVRAHKTLVFVSPLEISHVCSREARRLLADIETRRVIDRRLLAHTTKLHPLVEQLLPERKLARQHVLIETHWTQDWFGNFYSNKDYFHHFSLEDKLKFRDNYLYYVDRPRRAVGFRSPPWCAWAELCTNYRARDLYIDKTSDHHRRCIDASRWMSCRVYTKSIRSHARRTANSLCSPWARCSRRRPCIAVLLWMRNYPSLFNIQFKLKSIHKLIIFNYKMVKSKTKTRN